MGAGYRFQAKDESAEILIYEDVGAGWFGGVTAKDVHSDLKSAGKVKKVDVRIASYGGDVIEGLAIYRLLAEHDARVVVHVDSTAASIASVIAMAGDERVIAEAGSIMIHDAWTISAGNADEFERMARELRSTSGQLADIYAKRTGNGLDQVKSWMGETKWFYGSEAVEAGFADSIAPNVQLAASASMWSSVMRGRIAQRIQLQRMDASESPTTNTAERAALQALTDRVRARRAAHPKT